MTAESVPNCCSQPDVQRGEVHTGPLWERVWFCQACDTTSSRETNRLRIWFFEMWLRVFGWSGEVHLT